MDNQNYYYTKDAIKQRMIQHAKQFWEVPSVEELDPAVTLLIEGLASEIFTLKHAAIDSEIRILEYIADLLTPGTLISTRPAHSIATASPIEPTFMIQRGMELKDSKVSHEISKNGVDTISFFPVTDVRLTDAKIKYVVSERMLYKINNEDKKVLFAKAQNIDERVNNTMWIGFAINPEVESFRDVSFYFDLPNIVNKHEKYTLFPYAKWYYKGRIISTKTGLPEWNDDDHESILNKYDLNIQIDQHILDIYKTQFITIDEDILIQDDNKENFPNELKPLFMDTVTSTIEPCHWIKVTFPPQILADELFDLNVNFNSFPVANKIKYSVIYTPNHNIGILPLHTQRYQHFLSIESVTDSHGNRYHYIPYTSDQNETGVYALKMGGAERFDVRDSKAYIERLIDLLRSETVAFSAMEMDNLRNIVTKIEKNLTDLNTKYENTKMEDLEIPYYLSLKTKKPNDTVYIDYWATNSYLANGLRSGRILSPTVSLPIHLDSCKLLKQLSGGKSAANPTEKLSAYRYALTSHDMILTNDNIVNFIQMELSNKITNVQVKKGVAVSIKPLEGLIKTIDIFLSPTPGCEQILFEAQTELMTMLKKRSPASFNYRIIFA